MAAAQSIPLEVDKSEEEDPVKEGDSLGGEGPSSGRRASAGVRHARVPQQFVSTPVESPLGVGRATGRHGEIWT